MILQVIIGNILTIFIIGLILFFLYKKTTVIKSKLNSVKEIINNLINNIKKIKDNIDKISF